MINHLLCGSSPIKRLVFGEEVYAEGGRLDSYLLLFFRPVCLAAIKPTLAPGGAVFETVVGLNEEALWAPPPWGWDAGTMATPFVLG